MIAAPARTFEDFQAGADYALGSLDVTAEEVAAFAAEFDPQPMHLDAAAAAESMLGGLAASGWHTTALMMRLLVDGLLAGSASMGSAGFEHVTWHAPTRPGSRITGTATVIDKRISRSRPEMGLVRVRVVIVEASTGERLLEAVATLILGVREHGG